MSRWSLALLSVLAVFGGSALAKGGASATVIYVAPNGDDAATGATGHPVRTVARAQALLRGARSASAGEVDLVFAAGTYPLARPLDLGPADSGSSGAPTLFRAALGATVEFTGGATLVGWRPAQRGEIAATFDPASTGGRCPAQLYVNGIRRERPRLPASGTFKTARAVTSESALVAQAGDLRLSFRPSSGAEIVILDAWRASRLPLSGYDPATRGLVLGAPFHSHAGGGVAPGTSYYIENAPVARLGSGQWQCDETARTIRYRPLPGEAAARLTVVAPRIGWLVRLAGSANAPVHDIRFERIGFRYSGWTMPVGGWAAMQAAVGLPAAIEATQCARLSFESIRVHGTGAGGLRIGAGCRDVEVADSSFTEIGGGALMIGPEDRGTPSMWPPYTTPPPYRVTSNIRVLRNTIAQLGRVQPDAAGIWQGQADHVAIENNRISDLYYSGISIGWVWNSSPGVSGNNRVVGNTIANYGQGLLSDMGGIYTLGAQPGTLVANNQISGGNAAVYGGWGLYADQGSSGILFRGNIVRDTSHAAIFTHETGVLRFEDNTASKFGETGIRCSPPRRETQVDFVGNAIAGDAASQIGSSCVPPHYKIVRAADY